MRKLLLLLIIYAPVIFAQKSYKYPITPKDSIVDMYFNEQIYDPYQWMENPNDPRLGDWLDAQNAITKKQANQQTRYWELRKQIASMYNDVNESTMDDYIKTDAKLLNKYVFEKRWNKNHSSPDLLYKLRDGKMFRTLIEGQRLSPDENDHIAFAKIGVNEDKDLVYVRTNVNGSDWQTAYLFDLKTGTQLPDTIKYIRSTSSIEWHGKNLYYDRYAKPEQGRELLEKAKRQQLYYHKLGTSQLQDRLMFENPDTTGTDEFRYSAVNKRLFFAYTTKVNKEMVRAFAVSDMSDEKFALKNFLYFPNVDSIKIEAKLAHGDTVLLKTNWMAPNERILMLDIKKPNKLSVFVPEYDINLREVNQLGKDKIACIYRNKGQNIALIFNFSGELLKRIDFPKGKKVNYFFETNEETEYTNFCVSSFYHPDLWYQISLKNFDFKPMESVWVPFNAEALETRYVEYESKDGTVVPMYLTCKKNTKLNGKNPVLLYGYGGYGVTVEPRFDQSTTLFLLHGGILAVPNIRGGGGLGNDWALEGRRLKKQNAINDFIGAAEYLIKENYTNREKLAINGASHGGLLVASAIIQRPDLFKAAIAEAGPYDMLRGGKYTALSVAINLNEFGTVNNLEDFENIKSYSPLHTIETDVSYPNVLLITGDHDDRVPPFHTFKFLSALQEKGDSKSLYHLYLTPGSGHGGALTPQDAVDKLLYKYYFLFDQLGIVFY
ncbi:MAG: S9 family peptidase [Bacteroidales bacterium]|nr:S9 family peptidase [Bacteroidales bacterium]